LVEHNQDSTEIEKNGEMPPNLNLTKNGGFVLEESDGDKKNDSPEDDMNSGSSQPNDNAVVDEDYDEDEDDDDDGADGEDTIVNSSEDPVRDQIKKWVYDSFKEPSTGNYFQLYYINFIRHKMAVGLVF